MGFTKAGVYDEHLAVLALNQSSDEYNSDEDQIIPVGRQPRVRCRAQQIVFHKLNVTYKCRTGKRWIKRFENLDQLCKGEPERSDFQSYQTNGSIFQRLFKEPQSLKIWQSFTELPEDQQTKMLEIADQLNKKRKHNTCSVGDGEDIPYLHTFIKSVPLEMVERFEKEILDFFSERQNSIITFPSSLNGCERRTVHEICQYYHLTSKSINSEDNGRQVIVSNEGFFQPHMLLSDCLKVQQVRRIKKCSMASGVL